MCTADMSFYSLVSQILEGKQSRTAIYVDAQFMHNFRPGRGQTVDKPCTNRGKTYLERGQGYWSVQLISCCCATARFWIHPIYMGNNLGFNLDTLDGTRIQTNTVLRPESLALI